MDKKTVYLELPSEIIDRVDHLNFGGDRSNFIAGLLSNSLERYPGKSDFLVMVKENHVDDGSLMVDSGEVDIINYKGLSIGRFNINTLDGFDYLVDKIAELSDNDLVKTKAKNFL